MKGKGEGERAESGWGGVGGEDMSDSGRPVAESRLWRPRPATVPPTVTNSLLSTYSFSSPYLGEGGRVS